MFALHPITHNLPAPVTPESVQEFYDERSIDNYPYYKALKEIAEENLR